MSALTPDSAARLAKAVVWAEAQPVPPMLSRHELLQRPAIWAVALSPGGTHVAFLERHENRNDMWVLALESGERRRILADVSGTSFTWAGDGSALWIADAHGLAHWSLDTSVPRRVLQWNTSRRQRLFGVDMRAPKFAVVAEQDDSSGASRHKYWRLDSEGETFLLTSASAPLRQVLLDTDGSLAVTAGYEGDQYDTVIRQFAGGKTQELMRCAGLAVCAPVGLNAGGDVLVLAQTQDKLDLHRWHDGKWSVEHQDPAGIADADTVLWDAEHGDWQAIAYHGATKRWFGRTPEARGVLAILSARFPVANLGLAASRTGRVWLVTEKGSARQGPRYWVYRPATQALAPLFESATAQEEGRFFVAAIPVTWRAGDGLAIHGYVYLPPGRPLGTVPLVAWLHGGPHSRLFDEFDPQHQLLANRGVAVFVPNFRGSSGYGLRYALATKGDVGKGRVLQDVIDGLDALLRAGVGSPTRQGVAGHSFGAYTALLAASHHPDRFKTVFAAAPPTDYGWIKAWQASHDSPRTRGDLPPLAISFAHYGFPFENDAWRRKMTSESPLTAVRSLEASVTLWGGGRDDRVPLKSLANYAAVASASKKKIALIVDADAGHVPQDDPVNTEAFFYLIERAAQQGFATAVEEPSADLKRFLAKSTRLDSTGQP